MSSARGPDVGLHCRLNCLFACDRAGWSSSGLTKRRNTLIAAFGHEINCPHGRP